MAVHLIWQTEQAKHYLEMQLRGDGLGGAAEIPTQVGETVYRTIISCALHKSDIYTREERRNILLKEN